MSEHQPSIGIECHVQLNTKTKLFAAVNNDSREAEPNTLISHICVGLPGALPFLNEKALELAARAAFALNTEPQKFSKFERKHYFYPDLPKGYQITQYEQPIIVGGQVDVPINGNSIKVAIDRVQLEEDAGKNTHPTGADYSLVDLNRAGTPLLEIVSKPDMHSAAEAKAYARELWLIMKYAGVTEGDMYQGQARFDVNISLSSDPNKLGIRSEIKNLNSFRSVEGAVAYEIKRQTELLDKGQTIVQETRGWDEAKQKTTSQREKEEAHDYRYMPEPDIPPIELDEESIKNLKNSYSPNLARLRDQLRALSFVPNETESLINLDVENNFALGDRIFILVKRFDDNVAMRAANWMLHRKLIVDRKAKWPSVDQLADAIKLYSDDKISSNTMDAILVVAASDIPGKETNIQQIAEDLNLFQVSDEGEIEKIVAEVLNENQEAAQDVKNGEAKAIGFLVGQVMAKSQGKANPGLAQEIIKRQLSV